MSNINEIIENFENSVIPNNIEYQKIEVATSHGNEVYTVWDIDDEDEQIEKLLSIIQLKGSKQ